jgi:hypothetical protein
LLLQWVCDHKPARPGPFSLTGIDAVPSGIKAFNDKSPGLGLGAFYQAALIGSKKANFEKLERSTLRQYRNHANLHIKPSRIGTEKLARSSTPAIEAFRDDLLKKCSRPMARKVVASLKSILGEAQRRALVAQNAAQPVRVDVKRREQAKLAIGRDIPSKAEIQTILAHAEGRWRPFLVTAVLLECAPAGCAGLPGTMSISTAMWFTCASARICGARSVRRNRRPASAKSKFAAGELAIVG